MNHLNTAAKLMKSFTYHQECLATAKRCRIKCWVLDLESSSQQQKLDT